MSDTDSLASGAQTPVSTTDSESLPPESPSSCYPSLPKILASCSEPPEFHKLAYSKAALLEDPLVIVEEIHGSSQRWRHFRCAGCGTRFNKARKSKEADELAEWLAHKSRCPMIRDLLEEWEAQWHEQVCT